MSKYVSYSMLSSMKCPRYWYYVYKGKLYPREKPIPFVAGNIWHEGVHQYFTKIKKKIILRFVRKEFSKQMNKVSTNQEYTQRLLEVEAYTRAALRGYFKTYPRDEFKTIATEKSFKINLTPSVMVRGRIDRVVRNKNKEIWIMEHKFTSQDKGYIVRSSIDQQITIYYLAMKLLKLKPRGIIYDIAKKPYKKPLKHETMVEYEERLYQDYKSRSEFYFKREELIRTTQQLDELKRDLISKVRRLKFMEKKELYDRETSHCNAYFNVCEYFPLCSNPKSHRNKLLYTNERS